MPCANCGKTYEEHRSGLACRDFTGAGTECNRYVHRECHICGGSNVPLKEYDDSSPADGYTGVIDVCERCAKEHCLDAE